MPFPAAGAPPAKLDEGEQEPAGAPTAPLNAVNWLNIVFFAINCGLTYAQNL